MFFRSKILIGDVDGILILDTRVENSSRLVALVAKSDSQTLAALERALWRATTELNWTFTQYPRRTVALNDELHVEHLARRACSLAPPGSTVVLTCVRQGDLARAARALGLLED